jgi:hypothetical protein
VPEIIDHWRGAHLLYPTPAQLLRQRLLWAGVALVSYALITGVSIALLRAAQLILP